MILCSGFKDFTLTIAIHWKMTDPKERLCSQQIEKLIEDYKEPGKARQFLMDAGIIDADGNLMPPYQPI
jgi:hypothetical protein